MRASFGEPQILSKSGDLAPPDWDQVRVYWYFEEDVHHDLQEVKDWLRGEGARVVRVPVVLSDGRQFQLVGRSDSALLFEAGTTVIVGHAIQHGFVCRDPELWTALAELRAEDFKEAGKHFTLSYSLEEEPLPESEFDWYPTIVEEALT